MVSRPVFPHCYYKASSPTLPGLAHSIQSSARSRDSSPALTFSDLSYSHSYHQGELYCLAQARWRLLPLITVGGISYGHGVGENSALLLSFIQGWLACTPYNSISPSVLSWWGQGLLSCVLQLVRGRASILTLVTLGTDSSLICFR